MRCIRGPFCAGVFPPGAAGNLKAEVYAMNSLTPFIRHEMDNLPGPKARPGANSSRNSPPLGRAPVSAAPAEPNQPGSAPAPAPQPPAGPGQTPHPGPDSIPRGAVPYTDGTPAASRQKNAASFLAGTTPGVMAAYMPENNRVNAKAAAPRRARPAQQDDETVQRLVEWREEAPYG